MGGRDLVRGEVLCGDRRVRCVDEDGRAGQVNQEVGVDEQRDVHCDVDVDFDVGGDGDFDDGGDGGDVSESVMESVPLAK